MKFVLNTYNPIPDVYIDKYKIKKETYRYYWAGNYNYQKLDEMRERWVININQMSTLMQLVKDDWVGCHIILNERSCKTAADEDLPEIYMFDGYLE